VLFIPTKTFADCISKFGQRMVSISVFLDEIKNSSIFFKQRGKTSADATS